jgi:hypothetical protein
MITQTHRPQTMPSSQFKSPLAKAQVHKPTLQFGGPPDDILSRVVEAGKPSKKETLLLDKNKALEDLLSATKPTMTINGITLKPVEALYLADQLERKNKVKRSIFITKVSGSTAGVALLAALIGGEGGLAVLAGGGIAILYGLMNSVAYAKENRSVANIYSQLCTDKFPIICESASSYVRVIKFLAGLQLVTLHEGPQLYGEEEGTAISLTPFGKKALEAYRQQSQDKTTMETPSELTAVEKKAQDLLESLKN